MGSHQRFSVLVAKYGATTNVLQPERHSRHQYSFIDMRRSALRRRQIGLNWSAPCKVTDRRPCPASPAPQPLSRACVPALAICGLYTSTSSKKLH